MEEIKCKGCGSLQFERGRCIYCGRPLESQQFIDEDVARQLDAARECMVQDYDFAKASGIIHSALEKQSDCSEANFLALLAENQIIYIKNAQDENVPTFLDAEARALPESKFYALLDEEKREMVDRIEARRQETVAEMDKVKGKPYDIFISYKQHESDGETLTPEADLAQRVYNNFLKNDKTRSMRIFFDKESLGASNAGWEPHIYSAIKTSKMMVVVASSIDNINSRWVKNEWLRFLKYKARGDKKEIVVLGTKKEDVNPELFPKMIADTKSQALYERDDWRTNLCLRAEQACNALRNDRLGTVEFVDKKIVKKATVNREDFALTELAETSEMTQKQNISFETRLKMVRSDLSSTSAETRKGGIDALNKLKAETTPADGKVDGRILALELMVSCGLYTFNQFEKPANMDKVKDFSVFGEILSNGGSAEWKYSVLDILYEYLKNSHNTKNKTDILNIVIDINYKKRAELLQTLTANAITELTPEIFDKTLPRLNLSAEAEIEKINEFALSAFSHGNYALAGTYAQKVIDEYDEGNSDAKDMCLLSKFRCKTYKDLFNPYHIPSFDAFDELTDILSFLPASSRVKKLDGWNDLIIENCRAFFPENFIAFYDRFLMFYSPKKQGEKCEQVADLALRSQAYDIALHYYNYFLQHTEDKAKVYWKMMFCDLRCSTEEDLYRLTIDIKDNQYFNSALESADASSDFTDHIIEVRTKQRDEASQNRAMQARREALQKSNDLWAEILKGCRCRNDDELYKLDYSVYKTYKGKFDEAIAYAEKAENKAQIDRLTLIKTRQEASARAICSSRRSRSVKIILLLLTEVLLLGGAATVVMGLLKIDPLFEFWTVATVFLFHGIYGLYVVCAVLALAALLTLIIVCKNFRNGRSVACLVFALIICAAAGGGSYFINYYVDNNETNVITGEGYVLDFVDAPDEYGDDGKIEKRGEGLALRNAYGVKDVEIKLPATVNGQKVTRYLGGCFGSAKGATIYLPTSLTKIEDEFAGVKGLAELVIPSSVTSIADGAFEGSSFEKLTLPSIYSEAGGETYLARLFGGSYFEGDDYVPEALKEVKLTSAQQVADYAFYQLKNIEKVTLGNSVKRIGERAFAGCSSLKSIDIGSGITEIGASAFMGDEALSEVNVEDISAFAEIDFKTMQSNPAYFAHGLKKSGKSVTSVTISGEKISSYAFANCKNITKIKVDKSVKSIGEGAFFGCSGLTSITLPFVGGSEDSYGVSAYFGYIFGSANYMGGTPIQQSGNSYMRIFYLPQSLKTVQITGGDIGAYAFSHCTNLTEVMLSGAGQDDENAFYGCSSNLKITRHASEVTL